MQNRLFVTYYLVLLFFSCSSTNTSSNLTSSNGLNCEVLMMYDEPCNDLIIQNGTVNLVRYIIINPLDTSYIVNVKKNINGVTVQCKKVRSKKFEQNLGKQYPYSNYSVFTQKSDSTTVTSLENYISNLNIAKIELNGNRCTDLMHADVCYIDLYSSGKHLVSYKFYLACNLNIHHAITSHFPVTIQEMIK